MEEIFKITPDKDKARALFEMAKDRFEDIPLIPKEKYYRIIETYYEVIKELLTSAIYSDGYKTLSHIKLIEYFFENYPDLNEKQIKLIDKLRKIRNDIVYYGKQIKEEFILNNEEDIKEIINILIKFMGKKL